MSRDVINTLIFTDVFVAFKSRATYHFLVCNPGDPIKRNMSIVDGNEAAASVAYRLNEVIAIYPITPSSPMGEWSDQWNSEKRRMSGEQSRT